VRDDVLKAVMLFVMLAGPAVVMIVVVRETLRSRHAARGLEVMAPRKRQG
jgi:hypothetical protein